MRKSELFLQITVFGATAALVFLIVARVYPANLDNRHKTETPNEITRTFSPPTFISILSLNLSLPVTGATIENNNWTLYEDKVSWLATSKTPGEGNVILFAHNKPHLFGNLKKLQSGDGIIVQHEGKNYTYYVVEKRRVTPYDTDAVLSDSDQLTLYTCDGSFDQKRLIVIAKPAKKLPS